VKKLSHEQSRRNAARRRRRVAARHRQAGHWGERSDPMLTSGRLSYEIGGNVEATPVGGLFAMHRLLTRLGLVTAIDANLELLKIHLPYQESDHVLTLAYSVLCGGTRLEDVDRLRNDVPLMSGLGARLLPDPTTTGARACRRTSARDCGLETVADLGSLEACLKAQCPRRILFAVTLVPPK
jgi:hypothetical protein